MRDQHRPAPMASIGCVALRLLLLSATVQNVAPLARTCLSKQTRRPASQQQLTKPCMPHQLATCTKSSAFLKRAMIRMDAQSYEQPSGNMSPEVTLEQLTQLTSKSLRDSVLKLMRSSRTKDAQIPRTGTSDPVLGANNLPLPEAPLLSMVELCANGQVSRFQSTLTSMHRACKLSARDVRLLRSNAPVLAVREGFILFDFGVLKGILQHDRLTLLGSDRDEVTALGSEVEKRLALSRSTLEAFEVRALDCLLELSFVLIEQSLRRLSSMVTGTLTELTDPRQTDNRRGVALANLLPMQISLSSLQTKAKRLTSVLQEILEEEDDTIAEMCLSQLYLRGLTTTQETPVEPASVSSGDEDGSSSGVSHPAVSAQAIADAGKESIATDQGMIETLLDVYEARLQSLSDKIDELVTSIDTTKGVLELTLDNERNRIARLELLLSMAGLCMGTCAAVSGFFGMNLLSGVEEVPGLFGLVTGCSLIFSASLFAGCWRRFRSVSREKGSRINDAQALKHVLASMDKVALLLRNEPALPKNQREMQEELRSLLEAARMPQLARERELQLLCQVLRRQQYA